MMAKRRTGRSIILVLAVSVAALDVSAYAQGVIMREEGPPPGGSSAGAPITISAGSGTSPSARPAGARRSRVPAGPVRTRSHIGRSQGGDLDYTEQLRSAASQASSYTEFLSSQMRPDDSLREDVCEMGMESFLPLHMGNQEASAGFTVGRDKCTPSGFANYVCRADLYRFQRANADASYYAALRRSIRHASGHSPDRRAGVPPQLAAIQARQRDLDALFSRGNGYDATNDTCQSTTGGTGTCGTLAQEFRETIAPEIYRDRDFQNWFAQSSPDVQNRMRQARQELDSLKLHMRASVWRQFCSPDTGAPRPHEPLTEAEMNNPQSPCNQPGGGREYVQRMLESIEQTRLVQPTGNACIGDDQNVSVLRQSNGSSAIYICPRALFPDDSTQGPSQLRARLARALGHSIDSCALEMMQVGEAPLSRLSDGLRACLVENHLRTPPLRGTADRRDRGTVAYDPRWLGDELQPDRREALLGHSTGHRQSHCSSARAVTGEAISSSDSNPRLNPANGLEAQYWGTQAMMAAMLSTSASDQSVFDLQAGDSQGWNFFCSTQFNQATQSAEYAACPRAIGTTAADRQVFRLRMALQPYCEGLARTGVQGAEEEARDVLAVVATDPSVRRALGCADRGRTALPVQSSYPPAVPEAPRRGRRAAAPSAYGRCGNGLLRTELQQLAANPGGTRTVDPRLQLAAVPPATTTARADDSALEGAEQRQTAGVSRSSEEGASPEGPAGGSTGQSSGGGSTAPAQVATEIPRAPNEAEITPRSPELTDAERQAGMTRLTIHSYRDENGRIMRRETETYGSGEAHIRVVAEDPSGEQLVACIVEMPGEVGHSREVCDDSIFFDVTRPSRPGFATRELAGGSTAGATGTGGETAGGSSTGGTGAGSSGSSGGSGGSTTAGTGSSGTIQPLQTRTGAPSGVRRSDVAMQQVEGFIRGGVRRDAPEAERIQVPNHATASERDQEPAFPAGTIRVGQGSGMMLYQVYVPQHCTNSGATCSMGDYYVRQVSRPNESAHQAQRADFIARAGGDIALASSAERDAYMRGGSAPRAASTSGGGSTTGALPPPQDRSARPAAPVAGGGDGEQPAGTAPRAAAAAVEGAGRGATGGATGGTTSGGATSATGSGSTTAAGGTSGSGRRYIREGRATVDPVTGTRKVVEWTREVVEDSQPAGTDGAVAGTEAPTATGDAQADAATGKVTSKSRARGVAGKPGVTGPSDSQDRREAPSGRMRVDYSVDPWTGTVKHNKWYDDGRGEGPRQ